MPDSTPIYSIEYLNVKTPSLSTQVIIFKIDDFMVIFLNVYTN